MEWGLRICHSNKLPQNADAAGLRPRLEENWPLGESHQTLHRCIECFTEFVHCLTSQKHSPPLISVPPPASSPTVLLCSLKSASWKVVQVAHCTNDGGVIHTISLLVPSEVDKCTAYSLTHSSPEIPRTPPHHAFL